MAVSKAKVLFVVAKTCSRGKSPESEELRRTFEQKAVYDNFISIIQEEIYKAQKIK